MSELVPGTLILDMDRMEVLLLISQVENDILEDGSTGTSWRMKNLTLKRDSWEWEHVLLDDVVFKIL